MVVQEQSVASQNVVLMQYFHEIPDKRMALLAMVLLLIASFTTLVVTFWTQCWFMLLVPITGFLIALGYAYRLCMINNPKLIYFAAMQLLLIVSPLLLAAANYECLGKAMKNATGISSNILWLPLGFLLFDIICLIIQFIGGSFLTNKDPKKLKLGVNMIIVGIFLALVLNVLFIGALIYINSTTALNIRQELWIALYATMICLLVRNIYRFVEFIESKMSKNGVGYLASHELSLIHI